MPLAASSINLAHLVLEGNCVLFVMFCEELSGTEPIHRYKELFVVSLKTNRFVFVDGVGVGSIGKGINYPPYNVTTGKETDPWEYIAPATVIGVNTVKSVEVSLSILKKLVPEATPNL